MKISNRLENTLYTILGAILGVASNLLILTYSPTFLEYVYHYNKKSDLENNREGRVFFIEAQKAYKTAEKNFENFNDEEAKVQIGTAIQLFELAYNAGVRDASYHLAIIHTGIENINPKRLDLCRYWMKESIKAKNPNADYGLCQ